MYLRSPTIRLSTVINLILGLHTTTVLTCTQNLYDTSSWIPSGSPFPYRPTICPLPVDSESASPDPWSYSPACVQTPNKPDTLCVYTSTTYRSGHGVSIITTPNLAAGISSTLLDDGIVPPSIRDHPSSPLSRKRQVFPGYEIKSLPNRGKGVIARRKIRAWDVVMVDYPAFVARMDFMDVLSPEQIRDVLRMALQQLPGQTQGEILELDRSTGGALVQDILNTNIFGIELGGVEHMGLYTQSSRLNHNCRPNTIWRYSKDTLAMEVIAARDIEIGEEITHSYTSLDMTSTERQSVLQQWNFICKCPLCSSSQRTIATSDRRLQRIRKLHVDLDQRVDLSQDEVDRFANELLRAVREEGTELQLMVHYEVIARAYVRVFDIQKAKRYAALAERAWGRYGGLEHDNVEGIRGLWKDVEDMV